MYSFYRPPLSVRHWAHRIRAIEGAPRGHRMSFGGIPDMNDPRNHAIGGMATRVWMGGAGLEPATPSLSSWCSPN